MLASCRHAFDSRDREFDPLVVTNDLQDFRHSSPFGAVTLRLCPSVYGCFGCGSFSCNGGLDHSIFWCFSTPCPTGTSPSRRCYGLDPHYKDSQDPEEHTAPYGRPPPPGACFPRSCQKMWKFHLKNIRKVSTTEHCIIVAALGLTARRTATSSTST